MKQTIARVICILGAAGLAAAICLTFLTGCSTTSQPGTPEPEPATPAAGAHAAAVCIGLTAVDPAAYDGWAGDCPGCDVDAVGLRDACTDAGIFTRLILNAEATWPAVHQAVLDMAAGLTRGDLLIVAMSGHGGQITDNNGDETDGLDETICLWDGPVRDDRVLELLRQIPAGLRVVLINDQCHSQGNFRSANARPLVKAAKTDWDGQLIQFAGCREDSYSYGAASGGTWTQSLLSTLKPALTWRQWFDAASGKMPANQIPQWVEFGAVTDQFRNAPIFQ